MPATLHFPRQHGHNTSHTQNRGIKHLTDPEHLAIVKYNSRTQGQNKT